MYKVLSIENSDLTTVIKESVCELEKGGLVVFPTETLYGVGADATNQQAIDKLLAYKARREGKPLSIAVSDAAMAAEYVEVNEIAENLYKNFLPGPLTVVSKSLGKVAIGVESETGTLGIRIPDYSLIREIIRSLGRPITATSANASYQKRPYKISDIFENISDKQKNLIDLVLDAGQLPKREPSTVVDTTLNGNTVLRQGHIKLNEIGQMWSGSPEETRKIGSDLIRKYKHYLGYKSVVFAMQGELGAGKTEMTKGIAAELEVKEIISSPTFVIEKEYAIPALNNSYLAEKKSLLFHIDTWRLFDDSELKALGFIQKISEGNVFVVEWADKISGLIEQIADEAVILWIKLEYTDKTDQRKIVVSDYKG